MKTFVSDDYQITIYDKGGFEARIIGAKPKNDVFVRYNPSDKFGKYWTRNGKVHGYSSSECLGGLWLDKSKLKKLHEALEVIGKQDLMDNEIVFLDKEEK